MTVSPGNSAIPSAPAARAPTKDAPARIEHEGILDVRDLYAYFKLREGPHEGVQNRHFYGRDTTRRP